MRQLRYLQAIQEALYQEMQRDPRVFILGEDIRVSMRGTTRGFVEAFGPERVLDMPISEAAFTGFATGAAMAGFRPVVEYQIPSLVYVAFDQLANQAAKMRYMLGGQVRLPITYLVMGAGAKNNAAGQHSDNPYPFLLHAGFKVVLPSTPYDMKGLLVSAIRHDDPVFVLCPAALYALRGPVPEDPYAVPLGVGEVKRDGSDVTVVATGHLVQTALQVAEKLAEEGIQLLVWDPRTLLPLDREGLLHAVRRTGRVVILDDSNRTCGFAAEVSALIAEEGFDALRAPIQRITRPDVPVPFSPPLEQAVLPGGPQLLQAVRRVLEWRPEVSTAIL
ncbi:MAG: alpha-ketoacid dehydrogenase subunit beta [Armatimonadetes bacterium]|nr:alpha-ketoacid dehydrogenase subunit beta [Armatimonadota bacterium]MDW8153859.1 alpha-ketoacid dehydrogenase subunit beta [Armatimonadota bacterium]